MDSIRIWTFVFVGLTFGLYLYIAFRSRVKDTKGFYVAGQGVPVEVGVFIGMAIVFFYAALGGMKGITWTQVAQYWVLITAFLIPAIAISIRLTGYAVPQIGMGAQVLPEVDLAQPYLLDKLNQINHDFGFSSYTDTFTSARWSKLNVFCVTLALMTGTAGLPHVIVRF